MTIRVVANLCWMVPDGVGGSEEYTVRLLRAVQAASPADVAVELAGPVALTAAHPDITGSFPTRTFAGPARLRPYRMAVESTWLPRGIADHDVVHHFGGRLPARRAGRPVVTIHDLQPLDLPHNFSATKRAYLGAVLPRAARRARLVTTVSDWVAADLVERFDLDADRVRVVPSTWDTRSVPDPDDPVVAELGDGPVVVYPAVTHPHKDHATLIQAARRLATRHDGLQLVLTGGAGRAESEVRRLVESAAPDVAIVQPGRVTASTVVSLIARADVLAFPSRYEGFGLPVLEAMRLGTAVVAARATALPEVVGPAGLLVPPGDVGAWCDALDEVLGDEARRARLRDEGRRRSEAFSPAAAGHRLLSVWREAAT